MRADAVSGFGFDDRRAIEPLVVTYHYVRPTNSDGVTGLTPEAFESQLRALGRGRRFLTADEFVAGHGRDAAEPGVLITFDDGLLDQYEHALPVLERLRVPAVFYIPMRPLDPALPKLSGWTAQHLLHALAQTLGWSELEKRVRSAIGSPEVDRAKMDALYHYEQPGKRWLKYVMAFVLEPPRARQVLDAINRGDEGGTGPQLDPGDWFMSIEQARDLQARGHALGGHGYDHVPLTTLPDGGARRELMRSAAMLNEFFGTRGRTMAYPFGRTNRACDALMREAGFTHGFTTDDRVDCQFLKLDPAATIAAA